MTLFALMLATLLQQPLEQVFRFQVDVRTVYVDVFVTRDGKALTGLTADDFEVLDNDVRQQIDSRRSRHRPLEHAPLTGHEWKRFRRAAPASPFRRPCLRPRPRGKRRSGPHDVRPGLADATRSQWRLRFAS